MIDTKFNFRTEVPEGYDVDRYSRTLKRYHKSLWNKPLPCGTRFDLSDGPKSWCLYHKSDLGQFCLSSDSIVHSYMKFGKNNAVAYEKYWPGEEIMNQIGANIFKDFRTNNGTISAHIIFPANKIENKHTINQARGVNRKICDRFDLTLECIRLFYDGKQSPLYGTLQRYKNFFNLFECFKGYIDFFLLQDLVDKDYRVKFFLEFDNFNRVPLPQNAKEYLDYKEKIDTFRENRTKRIEEYINLDS